MTELLAQLGTHGVLGLITSIAIWIAWKKDQQLQALYEKMLTQAQQDRDRNHAALKELNKTVSALVEYDADDTQA